MDYTNLASGGVGATIIVVLGIIYKLVNHKRVRSVCCGRKMEVSLDIDTITPVPPVPASASTLMIRAVPQHPHPSEVPPPLPPSTCHASTSEPAAPVQSLAAQPSSLPPHSLPSQEQSALLPSGLPAHPQSDTEGGSHPVA